MKNYLENGVEIFSILGNTIFKEPVKFGEYKLVDYGKDSTYEKVKLITNLKGTKKGSFAYVYIIDGVEVGYIGQTTITSRIQTPSSIGGFHKITGEVIIPSQKHGKRNISTFFQIYDLVKSGKKVEVFLIETSQNIFVTNEFGFQFTSTIKPQEIEKALQDEYKKYHKVLPVMHSLHPNSYKY